MSPSLDHGGDPTITDEVRTLARTAVAMARTDGCDCVSPEVEMSPTAEAPWWSPLVRHDESCALVRRFQRENGTPT